MPRTRPGSVLVVAIFNIIFGIVGLACCLGFTWTNVGLLQSAEERSKQSDLQARQLKEISEALPAQNVVEMSHLTLGILYSGFFLASGVGLILMQSWARWVSVFTAALALIVNAGFLVYELAIVVPTLQQIVRRQSQEQGQAGLGDVGASLVGGGMTGYYLLTNLPWVIFTLLTLILLLLPSVGAAFSAEDTPAPKREPSRGRRRGRDEDEDEEEDDRGERWRD